VVALWRALPMTVEACKTEPTIMARAEKAAPIKHAKADYSGDGVKKRPLFTHIIQRFY
jgi:hypothetical protein